MVRLTMISRITDALPLAEGLDNDKEMELEQYKQQAKVCGGAVKLLMSIGWVNERVGCNEVAAPKYNPKIWS